MLTLNNRARPYQEGSADIERLRRQLARYLQILAEMAGSQLDVRLPAGPAALANLAASVLQVELCEKQRLLATPSITAMLLDIADLLQRELRAWQIVQASRQLSPDEASSFSLN